MVEEKKKELEPFGLISIILGIISALIYFVSILLPISAIVFGILGITKKKKNTLAIIGLVLGCLFTFQYINVNYLIPILKADTNDSSTTVNYTDKFIIRKAEEYGFSCLADGCTYYDTSSGGVPIKWYFDLENDIFHQSFDNATSEAGFFLVGDAEYRYQEDGVASAVYYKSNIDEFLVYYHYKAQTGETRCDGGDCSFNITICQETKNRFFEIVNR